MNRVAIWVALSAMIATNLTAADWPCWRGPDRNGISKETGLNLAGISTKNWNVKIGVGYSSVTVADGRIYALGNLNGEDTISCLDAVTGKKIWRYSYSCSKGKGYVGPRATPVVANGKVYAFSRKGQLNCIDSKTGRFLWALDVRKFGAKNLSWQFSGSPIVIDGMVILNAGKNGMAFDAETGKKVWASSGRGGYATPMPFKYHKKHYVAIFGFDTLFIVQPKNGNVVASAPWQTKYNVNAADPVLTQSGDGIFISSGYGNAGALFKFTGRSLKQVWKNKNLKTHISTPVLLKGNLYGADGNTGRGSLVCVDLKTGCERWREKSAGYGSCIVADGKIFYLRDRGVLIVCKASPKGFAKLASVKLFHGRQNWTVPVLANGRLYCRGSQGDLVCMNLK